MSLRAPRLVAAAFLFYVPLSWAPPAAAQEVDFLTPADAAENDGFGRVVVHGRTALIGAAFWQTFGAVYRFDVETGEELARWQASDGHYFALFGNDVDTDGETAIVAAHYDKEQGVRSGAAYLFDVETGAELRKLLPTDGAADLEFGTSVAIDGPYAAVGMPRGDDFAGVVYVFDVATGQQRHRLTPGPSSTKPWMGWDVAVSGGLVLASAMFQDGVQTRTGAVYVFDAKTGQELGRLLASDGESGDEFGSALDVDGTRVLVGAAHADPSGDQSGQAYLFDLETRVQLGTFIPADGEPGDQAGWKVALDGDTAMVEARGDDDNGSSSGSAYLFDVPSGAQTKLLPSTGMAWEGSKMTVGLGAGRALIGVPEHDKVAYAAGGVFVFLAPGPLGAGYCGPAIENSSARPGTITAYGSDPAAANDVLLVAEGTAVEQFGMFLVGQQTGFVQPPGSQGNLCIDGAIGRYVQDVRPTGAAGAFQLQLDLNATPTPTGPVSIQPGETWYWQAWFRDKNPQATSNFTDGVGITFS